MGKRLGDARHTAADIGRAATALGYEPGTDLETGLRAQVEWAVAARAASTSKVIPLIWGSSFFVRNVWVARRRRSTS